MWGSFAQVRSRSLGRWHIVYFDACIYMNIVHNVHVCVNSFAVVVDSTTYVHVQLCFFVFTHVLAAGQQVAYMEDWVYTLCTVLYYIPQVVDESGTHIHAILPLGL